MKILYSLALISLFQFFSPLCLFASNHHQVTSYYYKFDSEKDCRDSLNDLIQDASQNHFNEIPHAILRKFFEFRENFCKDALNYHKWNKLNLDRVLDKMLINIDPYLKMGHSILFENKHRVEIPTQDLKIELIFKSSIIDDIETEVEFSSDIFSYSDEDN